MKKLLLIAVLFLSAGAFAQTCAQNNNCNWTGNHSFSGDTRIGGVYVGPRKDCNYVFDGDSITQGTGAVPGVSDWPTQAMAMPWFSGHGTKYNVAIGGTNAADADSRYVSQGHTHSPAVTGKCGYFFEAIGHNSLSGFGGSPQPASTVIAQLQSIWAKAKADGYVVIAFTIKPATAISVAANENERLKLNRLIRADAGWDILIPTDEIFTDPTDTTYIGDGTHPNATGYTLLARNVNAIMLAGGTKFSGEDATDIFAGLDTTIHTSSYDATSSDSGTVVRFSCSTSCTYKLLNPPPSNKWRVTLISYGSAAVTVNPNGTFVNGSSSSFNILKGGIDLYANSSNYYYNRGVDTGASTTIITHNGDITLTSGDDKIIHGFSCASPCTATIPNPSPGNGWTSTLINYGTPNLTIATGGMFLNGSTSNVTLNGGGSSFAMLDTNGTNYYARMGTLLTSFSQVTKLFGGGSCSGFLKSDGTCSAAGTTPTILSGYCSGPAAASPSPFGLFLLGVRTLSLSCQNAPAITGGYKMPSAGTLQNLTMTAGTGGVNASSGACTVYIGSNPSSITCTFGTGTSCIDRTHTASVAADDFVTVRCTTQTSETLANINASLEKQ